MSIKKYLKLMVEKNASDIFYRPDALVSMRIDGQVLTAGEERITLDEVNSVIKELAPEKQKELFNKTGDIDFGCYFPELGCRFRFSIFMQRGAPAVVARKVQCATQSFEDLRLPAEILKKLAMETRGLVLLTGTMGSGKSTTIAAMIDHINHNCNKHIITIEEPIEFTFQDDKCVIEQRELGADVANYAAALKGITLQSPDVIFIGNIRDYETVSAALTAAETGVLVLSTLHTVNAAKSIERLVNLFPPHQHIEVRQQLASLLKGVISLRLIRCKDKPGRVPAYESMLLTPTIGRLIREDKIWEINQFIEDGALFGMQSFNQSLVRLVREGKISEEDAANISDNRDEFALALKGIRKL